MRQTNTDCRSEDGITVGLIDALISIFRILATRDLASYDVSEALDDLRTDTNAMQVIPSMAGMVVNRGYRRIGCTSCGIQVPFGKAMRHKDDCKLAIALGIQSKSE